MLLENCLNVQGNRHASPRQQTTQHTPLQVTKQVRPNRHYKQTLAYFVRLWVSSSSPAPVTRSVSLCWLSGEAHQFYGTVTTDEDDT